MRLLTRTAVNTACAFAVLGLAACGTDTTPSKEAAPKNAPAKEAEPFAKLSGPEVVNKAMAATKKAKSMKIGIDTTSDGEKVSAHLSSDTSGNCTGTMAIGPAGAMEIRKTGDTVYTKYDEAMLREQSKGEPAEDIDAAVDMLAGKWLKSKASEPDNKDMLELCDLNSLLEDSASSDTEARKDGSTTVDGHPALRLIEKDGAATYTLTVATEGQPYILKIDAVGNEDPMTMTLSEFGKPVVVRKPAAKDMADIG
ncbi:MULTISPECIES: hypothetical protein [unclassified Streptomyces]|uniref:hypothetical protein n=1 Tax=unclassified Streptomyces TaxID=2593676 RepID=UPI002ED22219|nr:hypothetical protein OH827_12910 [Streptomyces sp. NBC_00891]WSY05853.1 hypothetical protein OG464_12910 [Streptomyces sp. NBC_00890]WSZ07477.1 hypothetical protein OG704_12910 [Streptomyces sp. NBC_00869]WSZ25024.1 hypothetical protein OG498_20655 [Streptomyces sp. NBC_00870]